MFKKFISYYKNHKKMLVFVLLMVAFSTAIELTLPIFSREIINELIPQGDLAAVLKVAAIMITLICIYGVSQYVIVYYGHVLGTNMEKDMRIAAFDKIETLSFNFFDKNKTGIILNRITSDLHLVTELAHHGVEELLAITMLLICGFLYLIRVNVFMTITLYIITLLLLFSLVFARNKMLLAFRKLRQEHGEINSSLESALSGIRLTRAFANEEFEKAKFEKNNIRFIHAYRTAYKAMATTSSFNNFFVQALNVSVIALGAYLVVQGQLSFGDLMTYYIYFNLIAAPIKRLMSMLETFQQGWAGFERFQELMDEPIEITNPEEPIYLENPLGEITFDNVGFKYNQAGKSVLKHFNLKIPAGKMIALVGPSGVGKTTIAQLIPRFYEISTGHLYIDDHDVREYDLQSLRRHIGYVQQDVTIFWGTIRENIEYGKIGASFAEIEAAAIAAGIHDFIMELPDGYNTMVGERGVMLSGGQKQRISLSRIFLRDPRILILDEATSALDNITEAYIQESIEKLTIGRTVVVVAHRLSTIQRADEIIVLDSTGVVQRGKHQELLNQDGHYKVLYEASQNGIIGT